MADWSKPTLTETKANLLGQVKTRDEDAITLADTRLTAPTNLPDYAKRWHDTLKAWQEYHAGAYTTMILGIVGGGTGANSATDARSNLGLTQAYNHTSETNVHSATSYPTASRIILRDAQGRAQVTAPAVSSDIATKSTVDTHAELTAGTHGRTGTLVGTSDVQTLTNKTLGSGCKLTHRGARAYYTSNYSKSEGGSQLAFTNESYDTSSIHSAGYLTVPSGVTRIRLVAGIQWAANATGLRNLQLTGTVEGLMLEDTIPGMATYPLLQNIDTGVIATVASRAYYLFASQSSGGSLNILGGEYGSFFTMEIVE